MVTMYHAVYLISVQKLHHMLSTFEFLDNAKILCLPWRIPIQHKHTTIPM